jgi:hypothetical protein
MKYEDVSWHNTAAEYPKGLPRQAAGTHTGMFLVWALLGDLGSTLHAGRLAQLRARDVTPGAFFFDECDGKLTDEDLSAEGNAFAKAYFDPESGRYVRDYDALLCDGLQSAYHVRDTWENFDKLKPRIDRRLAEWRRGELGKKPWWKFWEPFAIALAFVLAAPHADAQAYPTRPVKIARFVAAYTANQDRQIRALNSRAPGSV